jgi:hypothetical protein
MFFSGCHYADCHYAECYCTTGGNIKKFFPQKKSTKKGNYLVTLKRREKVGEGATPIILFTSVIKEFSQ